MKFSPSSISASFTFLRSTKAPTVVASLFAILIIFIGVTIDRHNTQSYRSELRAKVERIAGPLSGRIALRTDADINVAEFLVHAFHFDAGKSPGLFGQFLMKELENSQHFSAVALAPGFDLAEIFTRDGVFDETSGTLDNIDLGRLASDLESRKGLNDPIILSGTQDDYLTLIMPVPGAKTGQVWGAIAILIDEKGMMEASGVTFSPKTAENSNLMNLEWLRVALRDNENPRRDTFYGDTDIAQLAPMHWPVKLDGARWTLLTAPQSGWDVVPPDQLRFRILLALSLLAIIVPAFLISMLISERNRNIATLEARELNLVELSQRFNLAMEASNIGVWEVMGEENRLFMDARAARLHNMRLAGKENRGGDWLQRLYPEDQMAAAAHLVNCSRSQTSCSETYRVPQSDGSLRYLRSAGANYPNADGSPRITGIVWDVTADTVMTQTLRSAKENTDIKNAELELALDELSHRERELEELNARLKAAKDEADAKNAELELAKSRIEHNSLHDPLTTLANRRKLDIELDRLSQSDPGGKQTFSVLHLDLDRFKQINDTLGHAAGDIMLAHAARILTRNVRDGDLVARIGGDEFVILATNDASPEALGQLAQRIIAEFHQPLEFDGLSCRCGISIGIAQAKGPDADPRQILVNADIALYRAKRLGRNRYEFFTQNLQAELVNQKRTADEILTGLDKGEFFTLYQPQFDARTNQLTGVEALVRWNHPRLGVLTPDHFLAIADDLNVSGALDQIVLETVMKDKMRWQALNIKVPRVSVNVSSKRLHDNDLIDTLKSLQISPGEISFELVESIFLDESEKLASDNLERIKELGIDIEIDDFGTGHASIVSLLKLKPKRLKIDRQLVMPILTAPRERALLRSIIEIAQSLGVETVAEGVETMRHAVMLRKLGCDFLQGYAFSRPISFDDFTQAARNNWQQIAA